MGGEQQRGRCEATVALRAAVIGSIAGIGVGGLALVLLPPASLWLRAGVNGGVAAVAGGLIAWLTLRFLLRKPA